MTQARAEDAHDDHVIQPIVKGRVRLEASSACQLRCPSCPTTTGHTEAVVGKNVLRLADFVNLIDANPWIGRINLANYGEVFLNPDLLEIFAHAYRRNVTLDINTGANLNYVRDDVLEGLVRYQIAEIRCSIDGATQETYERYRVRGKLARVLANIRRINSFKKSLGSQHPRLVWQFIAFGHNQHEISLAQQLAAELEMKFVVKLNWDPSFSPVTDLDAVRAASGTGAASRAEFQEQHGKEYLARICHQLWDEPQINWDGKILGCCRNFWGEFGGNAFRDGLTEALNSEKMGYARNMLRGRAAPRADIPCTTCDLYIKRAAAEDWMDRPDPSPASGRDAAAEERWREAGTFAGAGRYKDAFASARVVLQLRPDHPGALHLLGQAAQIDQRPEAAEYYFAKATAARRAAADTRV